MKEIISKAMSSGLDFSQKGVLKSFLYKMDLDEETYDRVYVNLKNNSLEDKVSKVDFEDRIVLLPQCLRDPDNCEAEMEEFGYKCKNCGNCVIDDIKSKAEDLNYEKVYIVPGSSMAKNVLKKKDPSAVIAVACHSELVEGFEASHVYSIPIQGVPLLRSGCVNTEVDLEKVEEKLQMKN
ncbi:MAG: DUF116 domain-containing protein [Candidatus Aenigmatarchaeota archaeon]